jgi:hypothetical protein
MVAFWLLLLLWGKEAAARSLEAGSLKQTTEGQAVVDRRDLGGGRRGRTSQGGGRRGGRGGGRAAAGEVGGALVDELQVSGGARL